MMGTKRRNVSLRSDAEEAPSKKVLAESPLQSPAVETSFKAGSALPLDFKRALSSRQHVRALNTQFASWVQSQLQNHPDELWEDGVQDYLAHASRILEKFSDVVNWLKANSSAAGSLASVGAQSAEKKSTPEVKSGEVNPPSAKPSDGPNKIVPSFGLGSSSSSQASPSTASIFSSQSTSLFKASANSGSSSSSQTPPQGASLFASGVSSKSQNQSPLFGGNAIPWTSNNSQSSISGANASSGLSFSSQASSQSTSLFASGVSSKGQSQSPPVFGGNASPWTSSVFNSQSSFSGANASSGSSSSSQTSSQSTSPFGSGVPSKSQSQSPSIFGGNASLWTPSVANSQPSFPGASASSGSSSSSQTSSQSQSQSPLSGGNISFGLSSNSQNTPQSTILTSPWTSSAFSNSPAPSSGTTSGSAPSWSFGSFSNNQSPFTYGNQNPAPLNTATADNDNEENEEQPSSPSLKKSEEKGINVVHEVKCKLYMKSIDPADKDPWKDRGTGQLSIKCKEGESKGTKESKPTIIIRNDVGSILLNALLYPGLKLSTPKSNSIVAIFHTTGDNESGEVAARTFLIRTRNQEDRDKLSEVIKEHTPSA